jgi:hypothetical protein
LSNINLKLFKYIFKSKNNQRCGVHYQKKLFAKQLIYEFFLGGFRCAFTLLCSEFLHPWGPKEREKG